MCENTARRYRESGVLPSEMKQARSYRTREDPFHADDWAWTVERLSSPDGPKFEAKALFHAMRSREGVIRDYPDSRLRSFQRKVRRWRAQHGSDKEVFFPQIHRPGETMQTDWTHCGALCVTIAGEIFEHKLCVSTLPYGNWRSALVCRSESLSSLKSGVQKSLRKLGRRPHNHQTDQSSTATHSTASGRKFNDSYVDFMNHLGMTPRTIAVRKPNQNGDVESSNGVIKRALEQKLLLRGSRDFADVQAYRKFVDEVVDELNAGKKEKLATELEHMEPVTAAWAPVWTEEDVTVSSHSTIRVKQNTYSVPSRLIGESVRVRIHDSLIEVWFADNREFVTERLLGRCKSRIDYRHIIWSLHKKPGAFARYRHREELFPLPVFRRCYDAIVEDGSTGRKDAAYLSILFLAASTTESGVAVALELLLDEGVVPTRDAVMELTVEEKVSIPDIQPYTPQFEQYDELIRWAQ